ncbi:hypothetical protein D3C72_1433040 [compost metagenome]
MQDEVGHLLRQAERARMADADAQAPEIGTAQRGLNVLQAIVPGVSAALLELNLARHQVQFVVQHQHLFRRQFVEPRQRAHRLARAVHVSVGLEQQDVVRAQARFGHHAEKGLLKRKRSAQVVRQVVGQPEAGVVPGGFVVGTGVTQSHDEAYGSRHDGGV